jgi:hypothetical protein
MWHRIVSTMCFTLYYNLYTHSLEILPTSGISVWLIPVAVCTVLNSWWWTGRPSETCKAVISKIKQFWETGASSCIYYSNYCQSRVISQRSAEYQQSHITDISFSNVTACGREFLCILKLYLEKSKQFSKTPTHAMPSSSLLSQGRPTYSTLILCSTKWCNAKRYVYKQNLININVTA